MEANQLRIGNWVLYDGRPFKIYGISKEYPFLDTIEFGIGVVEWKDLQPIEITEEIALKLGGESDEDEVCLSLIEDSFFYIHYDYHFKRVTISKVFDEIEVECIEHLHQLQNIYFALTGQELKIELKGILN